MNAFIFFPIIIGALSATLVNYLADVLPAQRRLTKPSCPHCKSPLGWLDYALMRRCAVCEKRRPPRAWILLAVLTIFSVYLWSSAPPKIGYALSFTLVSYFALLFVIDVERRLILHVTSFFGFALMGATGWLIRGWQLTLLGGVVGFGFMLVLYYLGVWFARYRARKMQAAGQAADDEESLGFGDVMLGGVIGLLLGARQVWAGLLQGILLAGIFGVFLVGFMLFVRKYKENALMIFMPYAPFLILSALLVVFFPHWTLDALLGSLAQK